MPAPTTIRRLIVADLTIALDEPFGIAGGAQDVARNLLVTVELADGTRGYGEAAPFAAYNGETQERARAALLAAAPVVEGADVREWRRIAAAVALAVGGVGSAQCAVETAVLDALARQAQMPLWAFFGGAATTLETDMTVTTGTVAQAAAAAQAIRARGIRAIKIKVGGGDLGKDVARVLAVAEAAPGAPLIVDGNAAFSADAALQLLAVLAEHDVRPALFEQPVARDDWDGLRQVSRWCGTAVAADESVASAADALRLACEQSAHVLNIKLMKGGIVQALDIAAIARAAGLGLMIGGNVESILAMTTSACFAAGLGGFSFVDLDTPLFLAENPFDGGMIYDGGTLHLEQIAAGHGVTPRLEPATQRE
jgi:L-alanine-DL-glutamate epimerase-like enolase superfamily enzyme